MKLENKPYRFNWDSIGDIALGRKSIGQDMPVLIYRLFAYTLKDILCHEYDAMTASYLYREAGYMAGREIAKNLLDLSGDFDFFMANLSNKLKDLKISYLHIEKADLESQSFTLTVSEDLDCSGLPISDETICDYDEGFIAGILEEYSGKKFTVKEVDCWATGGRLCRFTANLEEGYSEKQKDPKRGNNDD